MANTITGRVPPTAVQAARVLASETHAPKYHHWEDRLDGALPTRLQRAAVTCGYLSIPDAVRGTDVKAYFKASRLRTAVIAQLARAALDELTAETRSSDLIAASP